MALKILSPNHCWEGHRQHSTFHNAFVKRSQRVARKQRVRAFTTATDTSTSTAAQDSLTANGKAPSTSYTQSSSSSSRSELLQGFEWQSHWWPVQVSAVTDPSKPHAVELLGRQLVLWRDAAGAWHCFEDACPHRLAPLSEGRLAEDGTLQCSYHGWRFNGSGSCTEIPQALDSKAKAAACSSKRSCATAYPVQEAYGLIWVWPSVGPAAAAAAAAAPLPVSKGLVERWEATPGGHHKWYRRELPYSFDMLVENLSDPSHLPFSHHKLTPMMLRERADAMPFAPMQVPSGDSPEDAAARPSFSFKHQAPLAAFSFPSVLSPSGRVSFSPPGCVVYQYDLGPCILQNDLLAVPAGPGRSVAYTLGMSNAPRVTNMDILKTLFTNPKQLMPTLFRASFQRRPLFQEHLGMNKLFDQDNVFLNMQDRILAHRGKSAWAKDYYMPAPCDGLVAAVRRWADAAYQLPLPAATTSSSSSSTPPTAAWVLSLSAAAAAGLRLSPRQLNDRLAQHTQHCTECSGVLSSLKTKLQRAQLAAAASLAGLMGLLGAAVLPHAIAVLTRAQDVAAAAAAAAVAPSSTAAAVGNTAAAAGGGALGVAALLMGVVGLLAVAVARSTAELITRFEYVEFSHADNH